MSADSTHLAGGMEREDWERNLFKYYYYHFCYYYCGRIAKMCVRGACLYSWVRYYAENCKILRLWLFSAQS